MHAQNGWRLGAVAGPDGRESGDDAMRPVEDFRVRGNGTGVPDAVDLTVGARRTRAVVSGYLTRFGDQHQPKELVIEHAPGRVEALRHHGDRGPGTGTAVSGGRLWGNHQTGYHDTCRERG